MSEGVKKAQAGSLESGDILIMLNPAEKGSGAVVEVESIVMRQYGNAIRRTISETLNGFGADDINVKAVDRGAMDYVIKARMKAALIRAGYKEGATAE